MPNIRSLSILGLIVLGICSRLIPHPPNFTAIHAIALFSVFRFSCLKTSAVILFIVMLFSDLMIGFHSTQFFVYLSYGLILGISYRVKIKKPLAFNVLLFIVFALLFFFITNFGVWLTNSFYPKTLTGLSLCYLAAVPFLANQLLGDCFYTVLIYSFFYVTGAAQGFNRIHREIKS